MYNNQRSLGEWKTKTILRRPRRQTQQRAMVKMERACPEKHTALGGIRTQTSRKPYNRGTAH
eukprot:15135098-Ditylum_brightwellii.AAC.1